VALKRTVAAYYGLFSLLHELVHAVSIWSIAAALRMVCANIFDCHVQVYQKQTGHCMNLTTGILSVSEDATTKQTCGPRFQSLLRAWLLRLIHVLQPLEEAHEKDQLENQLYHVNDSGFRVSVTHCSIAAPAL
jgi:hypothetical protein